MQTVNDVVVNGNMKIAQWISSGELDPGNENTDQVLAEAGRILDKLCCSESFGDVLFVGEDGRIYIGSVEFVIREANPGYVHAVQDREQDVNDLDMSDPVESSQERHAREASDKSVKRLSDFAVDSALIMAPCACCQGEANGRYSGVPVCDSCYRGTGLTDWLKRNNIVD